MEQSELQSPKSPTRQGKTRWAWGLGLAGLACSSALLLGLSPAAVAQPPLGRLTISMPQQAIGGLLWDRHEVSVEQFRGYARATGFVSRAEREGGGFVYEAGWTQKPGWTWQSPFGRPAVPQEPAVHLTFDEAQQACQAWGKRLPTDAEWVAAAYTEQRTAPPAPFEKGRTYRWPNGVSARASHCLSGCGNYSGLAPAGVLDRGLGPVAVGQTPPGVNGLHDMGGNVWEWVNTGQGQERVTRGASWWYGPERQLVEDVATKPRDTRVAYIGFRCVQELR
jgi:formylglycine-generating enzyme required for sulfatase activity